MDATNVPSYSKSPANNDPPSSLFAMKKKLGKVESNPVEETFMRYVPFELRIDFAYVTSVMMRRINKILIMFQFLNF